MPMSTMTISPMTEAKARLGGDPTNLLSAPTPPQRPPCRQRIWPLARRSRSGAGAENEIPAPCSSLVRLDDRNNRRVRDGLRWGSPPPKGVGASPDDVFAAIAQEKWSQPATSSLSPWNGRPRELNFWQGALDVESAQSFVNTPILSPGIGKLRQRTASSRTYNERKAISPRMLTISDRASPASRKHITERK